MANTNIIDAKVGGTAGGTVAALTNPTSLTAFQTNAYSNSGSPGGLASVRVPLFNLNGRQFKVRAVGIVTSGIISNTFSIALYQGNSATLFSDTLVAAPLSVTLDASQSTNWSIEAILQWDSTSGEINGYYICRIDDQLVGVTATNTVSGLASASELFFLMAAAFSVSSANNVATLRELAVEPV